MQVTQPTGSSDPDYDCNALDETYLKAAKSLISFARPPYWKEGLWSLFEAWITTEGSDGLSPGQRGQVFACFRELLVFFETIEKRAVMEK